MHQGEFVSGSRTYQLERRRHWDRVARRMQRWRGLGGGYHRRLSHVFRTIVPAGQRVLEIGCARGDLLAALSPSLGVGADISFGMLAAARKRHPDLLFVQGDAHDLKFDETFDYIVLSDLVNDLWDVQLALQNVRRLAHERTRIVVNTYSRLWEFPLLVAEWLFLSNRKLQQNWLTIDDARNLLSLAGYEMVRSWQEVLWPVRTPLIDDLLNRWLVKIPPLNHLALTNVAVARPRVTEERKSTGEPVVTVLVPARNEAGNIASIFERVPYMGGGTELVFVEGNSADDTYAATERSIAAHPDIPSKLFKQSGKGKGDAVRLGFEHASGDILMILDADMTVAPEDLVRFYDALVSRKCEFVNGVRLVYPMERHAMRSANLLGNKFFSLAFSWLLGQGVKDTLCGTKVLWKCDYERIKANRSYFGEFDPFGDFDLLFGAAKLNLKIMDMPIRYRERTYGTTNIRRWRHGLILLRMMLFAGRRLKFV